MRAIAGAVITTSGLGQWCNRHESCDKQASKARGPFHFLHVHQSPKLDKFFAFTTQSALAHKMGSL
jgi:predicted metal-binding membrane protein